MNSSFNKLALPDISNADELYNHLQEWIIINGLELQSSIYKSPTAKYLIEIIVRAEQNSVLFEHINIWMSPDYEFISCNSQGKIYKMRNLTQSFDWAVTTFDTFLNDNII